MKIDVTKPNILRIACRQEKNDQDYGSCLWAYFDFDLDEYMLNIQSDCGNAAHRWPKQQNGSFLHFMVKIRESYLLEKLFTDDEIVIRKSLKNASDWLEETDLPKADKKYALDRLREILMLSDDYSDAVHAYQEWEQDFYPNAPSADEIIVTDYTRDAKQIAKIFVEQVQPQIREILEEQEGEKHEAD